MEINDKMLLNIAKNSIKENIEKAFNTSYSSPVYEIAKDVIKEHNTEIRELCEDVLKNIVNSKDFKKIISDEFTHKIAKSLVSNLDGLTEKSINSIKQDSVLKSKMIIALEEIIINNQN